MKKITPYQLEYLSWLITHKRSVSDDERNKLIDECSASMKESVTETELFTFQWVIK